LLNFYSTSTDSLPFFFSRVSCPANVPRSAALIPQTASFNILRNNLNSLGRLSTGGQCVASGNAIVEMYTMGLGYWPIVGILIGFYMLFLVATYLVVKRSARANLKV
jgi:hypothetical protein